MLNRKKRNTMFLRLIFRAVHNKVPTYIFYCFPEVPLPPPMETTLKPEKLSAVSYKGRAAFQWRVVHHPLPVGSHYTSSMHPLHRALITSAGHSSHYQLCSLSFLRSELYGDKSMDQG